MQGLDYRSPQIPCFAAVGLLKFQGFGQFQSWRLSPSPRFYSNPVVFECLECCCSLKSHFAVFGLAPKSDGGDVSQSHVLQFLECCASPNPMFYNVWSAEIPPNPMFCSVWIGGVSDVGDLLGLEGLVGGGVSRDTAPLT